MKAARPVWCLVALACACSNAPAGSSAPKSAKADAGGSALDPKTLILKTDLGSGTVRAGQFAPIACRAFAPTATAGELGAEVDLPAAPTLAVIDGPAGPLDIAPSKAKFAKAGAYRIACKVPSLGMQDLQPPTLFVTPAPPVAIDTAWVGYYAQPPSPKPAQVKAGSLLQLACAGHDAFGNAVTDGYALLALPEQAAPPSGLVAAATKAGLLQIGCQNEGLTDETPLELQVLAEVPRHLFTLLDPPAIVAGNAAELQCAANDAYGNPIADFPFSLDYPPAVTIKGTYATATKTGKYKIQCVPETLDWSLFTLHPATLTVQPGPPAKLLVQAVPPKLVYKQEESVQFLSQVLDSFGNLVPTATVKLQVLAPAKGWKLLSDDTVKFAADNKYQLHFEVVQAPDLQEDLAIIVDGTPPALSIDFPPWGTTLEGKASVQVKGTAGDATSGIKDLKLNSKAVFPTNAPCQKDTDCAAGACNPDSYQCTVGTWVSQHAAKHGLNRLEAKATDLGGQQARATRGFYYSGKYYPKDGSKPDAELVPAGMQVFLGHDFFDDGDHDPQKPNDLATLMEMAIAGMDVNSLLPPGGLNQGGVEVKLSNFKFDKPAISLQTVDGGLNLQVKLTNLKTDIAVKATQKVGPIPVTISVSGDVKIEKLIIDAGMGMAVFNGFVETKITKSAAKIEKMTLHVDGIGGLFDFLWNIILDGYEGQIADSLVKAMNDTIPKLVGGLLAQFSINQAIPIPAAVKGGKDVSITLVSKLQTLTFSPKGLLVLLDAGFGSQQGTVHKILGAIARSGCINTVEDAFAIDQTKRVQVAMHDDIANQLLHAVWFAGGLKMDGLDLKALGASAQGSPIPLDGATLDIDLFLPPIMESCGGSDPMAFRGQVGDAYIQANVPIGDPPLSLGFFGSFDLGATMALGTSPQGKPQLKLQFDKQPQYHMELVNITKDFADQKAFFEGLVTKLLTDQLAKGIPGLDQLNLDLPGLDIGGLLPGMPAGSKIAIVLTKLHRGGGFTAIDAELQ